MLAFRYLTTIPDFIARAAALHGGELHVGGQWGQADNLAPRAEYAPLVRVSRDGAAEAALPWESTWAAGAYEFQNHYVGALAEWQGLLWASGRNGTGNERLASWDGDAWTTQAATAYEELAPWAEGLFLQRAGYPASVLSFDGLVVETVAQVYGSFAALQPLSDGRMVALGTSRPRLGATPYSLYTWLRAAGEWQEAASNVPVPLIYSYTGSPFMRYWRGGVWCVVSDYAATGSTLQAQVGDVWRTVGTVSDYGLPGLTEVRNRLVAYTPPGAVPWGITSLAPQMQYEQLRATAEQATVCEYDGRTIERYLLDGLAPYLVVPLGDGSAVAFCRSADHLAYLRSVTYAQYGAAIAAPGGSPQAGGAIYTTPDMDTLVYLLEPVVPHPPEVPYGDLYGNVADFEAAAIAGAEVQTGLLSDLTDAAGDYGIDALPIGRHEVAVSADGYLPENTDVEISSGTDTEQDFALDEITPGKAAVWGWVRDGSDGMGLAGAAVTVGLLPVTSGAGGFWALEVDPGTYAVACTLPGYTDGDGGSVTVAAGESVQVDLRVYPDADYPGTLQGTVRDAATGAGVAGALVTVGDGYTALSDTAGAYCRRGLPLGEQVVVVTATGYQAGGGTVVLTPYTRADWALVATGTDTGSLRVFVTDIDTGLAIEGATVAIPRVGAAVTDSLGVATLAGLVAGTYTVVVEAAGYYPGAAAGTVVALTTADVSVALTARPDDARGWLWGLAWDGETLTPLGGVSVALAGRSHPDNAQTATSDATGFWLVDDLHVGPEDLAATLTGYRDAAASNVPVAAGSGTRCDLALVPTGTDAGALQGTVLDAADNSGVGQAEVWLDSIATAYSDDLGAYSFPVVAVGDHEADAFAAGFLPARVGNIPVADGVTTWLDIPLHRVARLGTLVVLVVDGDGVAVAGAAVVAAVGIEGVTDADGEVTLADVPEGWYNVLAYLDGYVPGATLVQTLAGETVTCTVTITAQDPADTDGYLVGLVLDQWTGAGLRGATVAADGTVDGTTTSGLLGAYSLALAADTYDVTGSAPDYLDRVAPDVVVASRQVTRCDLVLLPGDDPVGADFVGVPAAASIPEGGPRAVLVDYVEDGAAAWELAVSTDGGTRFRRGQRVGRGIETVLEQPGSDVRILGRRTSGQFTGIAASLRP